MSFSHPFESSMFLLFSCYFVVILLCFTSHLCQDHHFVSCAWEHILLVPLHSPNSSWCSLVVEFGARYCVFHCLLCLHFQGQQWKWGDHLEQYLSHIQTKGTLIAHVGSPTFPKVINKRKNTSTSVMGILPLDLEQRNLNPAFHSSDWHHSAPSKCFSWFLVYVCKTSVTVSRCKEDLWTVLWPVLDMDTPLDTIMIWPVRGRTKEK